MTNLPVKFTRGNFDYFLGRLNGIFYEEASALQLFVLTILRFVRTFRVKNLRATVCKYRPKSTFCGTSLRFDFALILLIDNP